MFIDDPDHKGPRCHMCMAPVKDPRQIEAAERLAEKMTKEDGRKWHPRYFCTDECVIAKYVG